MNAEHAYRMIARAQRGFSLIEILIVVALIALIAGMVANQVFGGKDTANYRLAQSNVVTLAAKVEAYQMDTGALPQRLEDLVTAPGNAKGWLGPYVRNKDALRDPWGTEYAYSTGSGSSGFTITSYAKDRKPGGSGLDADITND